MRSLRLTLILISVLATLLCIAAWRQQRWRAPRVPRTVVFDATFTAQRTAGPDANHVGHRQIASGVLRNSTGRAVGRFAFTCIWTRILAGGDALERCSGSGRTADGRLEVAGPARESEAVHHWKLTGESGAYRGAHGTLLVRDIGDRESLITATVTPASRDGPARRGRRPSRRRREPHRPRRSDLHPRVSTAGGAPTVPVYQLRSAASRSRAAAPGRRVLHRPG